MNTKNILIYFDLNKRARKAGIPIAATHHTTIIGSRRKKRLSSQMSLGYQIFMYIGIFLGVLFSNFVSQLDKGNNIDVSFTLGKIIFSSFIALIITPITYEKLKISPSSPFIVQFGFFVQHGLFWQVIINAISKTF